MGILESKDLCKTYGSGENEVKALDHVSINIEDGEFISIVGTSGSGKSTLLNMLGGLDRPDSGIVNISGKQIFSMSDEELTIFRRRNIGFIFQNYNLVPVLNVYENIVLPIELDGSEADKDYVNLPVINPITGEARALAYKPAIILADEPTGNLDSHTSMDVISLLKVTSCEFNQTIVMITHNEEIAVMADRIIRIEDGKVEGEADVKK